MNEKNLIRASKRLSLHLRHRPDLIGVELDPAGWIAVDVLLTALARHGTRLSRAELDEVVAGNNKQRFAFDATGTRIRANQGHSVGVDLELPVATPPEMLFHGTVAAALPSILREGLRPMKRHHVHLSADRETAVKVGSRRGKAIVLEVDATGMVAAGAEFRRSENGVWLVDHVPVARLRQTP